jgi:hypothetical protein
MSNTPRAMLYSGKMTRRVTPDPVVDVIAFFFKAALAQRPFARCIIIGGAVTGIGTKSSSNGIARAER